MKKLVQNIKQYYYCCWLYDINNDKHDHNDELKSFINNNSSNIERSSINL